MKKTHEQYMNEALNQAHKAFDKGEVPIGAIIVDPDGVIIGSGYNEVEKRLTQTSHAEMIALQKGSFYKSSWRLDQCVIYVTLEPCTMCFAAIALSRLKKVYYGAPSPVFGFHLDNDCFLSLYNNDALFVRGGIKESECKALLTKFFKKKRENNEFEKRDKKLR